MFPAVKISDLKLQKREQEIQLLPVERIRPNPYQPRKYFDKQALNELAESIKSYGVLQPISVRLINGTGYELVAGERRLRAAKIAGLKYIPCIVSTLSDNDSAMIALIENLEREDLNFIEEALGYQNLINDYKLTQEALAERLNKNQSTIANKLRILKLSAEMQRELLENGLTERHARALLKIPDEKVRAGTLKKIIDRGLNVKKTEELVEAVMDKIYHNGEKKQGRNEKRMLRDIRPFINTVKKSIEIMKKSGFKVEYLMEELSEGYKITVEIPYK